MIPKIIHYIHFGGLDTLSYFRRIVCFNSIKKFCPDYQIMFWNEETFNINLNEWTITTYKNKQFDLLSDFVRLYVLDQFGGIYIDTDVEIIKPIDDLLNSEYNFMGFESRIEKNDGLTVLENSKVAPGLIIGVHKDCNDEILKTVLKIFEVQQKPSSFPLMYFTNNLFIDKGLTTENKIQIVDNWKIYPFEYFCPKCYYDKSINYFTENTYTIHHYGK